MRFATFEYRGVTETGVFLNDDTLIGLGALTLDGAADTGISMMDVIHAGDSFVSALHLAIEQKKYDGAKAVRLADATLLPPIPRPQRNVFCVGRNYIEHVMEGDRAQKKSLDMPTFPQFFTKPPTAVIGPGQGIPQHAGVTSQLDYEVELAVIIGKRGTNIPAAQALDHIFGVSIINDISARDLQRRHGQWFKGKALDGSCPFGPCIVHHSAWDFTRGSRIQLSVNGQLRQSSHTNQMMFGIPTIIEQLSAGLTLEPGDIIATGTPSGVGYAMEPPQFLVDGDHVVAEIEGLGRLENTVTV